MGQTARLGGFEKELNKPTVPAAYVLLFGALLEARGVPPDTLFAGSGVTWGELSREGARVTPLQLWSITSRGVQLLDDPALSFAYGFEMKPTAHGLLGYAAMTCATLGGAIRLLERFMRLRVRAAQLTVSVTGELCVLKLRDDLPDGPVRHFLLESITAAMLRAAELLVGERPPTEIWLDYQEPPYFSRVKAQLPTVRFGMPSTELRLPKSYLDRPLLLADPLASNEAVLRLERELSLLDEQDANLLAKLRALLSAAELEFPSLATCAKRMGTSERTLKRKLQRAGTSYQKLLDETRLVRATALLESSDAPVERVAAMLGYNDAANFTRAFRRWTGKSPRAFRNARRTS